MKNPRLQVRNFLIVFVPVAILFLGSCIYLARISSPPKEETLLKNFNQHRAAFEQLRDMLTADTNLNRIGTWGVNMSKPHFVGYPNEQQFPKDRFEKYQSLLNEVGSVTAIRKDSSQSDPAPLFYLWSWGTAVSSRHYNIGICWLNQEPTNQIPTLDGYHSHSENGNAYRHIDSHWYFWTDL